MCDGDRSDIARSDVVYVMRCRDGDQDKFACWGLSHRRVPFIALSGKFPVEWVANEVERETVPLDLVRTTEQNYLAATISRSSTSKTNVAPGLIVGGAPLSP
jgi:hypothetical protein